MSDFDATIHFFGAFRKLGDKDVLRLPAGVTAAAVKDILSARLAGKIDARLVADSAIARNDMIAESSDIVRPGDVLAVLPPVCGG